MSADLTSQPRRAGVLLHPTSLPPSGTRETGIGDIGPAARTFVDWLAAAGQRIWQVLPLNVVDDVGCPYASESAFAHEPLLLSLEDLVEDGFLSRDDLERAELAPSTPGSHVSYREVSARKRPLLQRAAENVPAGVLSDYAQREPELTTWALYRALTVEQGRPWVQWEVPLRDRFPDALDAARERLAVEVQRILALQWLFDRQWSRLHAHARALGVELWGDVPIFVGGNCADVWARPHLWRLDADRAPVVVSGVPPDAFSELGQLWGHPLYDNAAHAAEGYAWWRARLARALGSVDRVRIDHFRGFEAVWEIPTSAVDARSGRWVPGLGRGLLQSLQSQWPSMPFIAEDLGVITDDVRALRDGYNLPGMVILQFAFGGPAHDPERHRHPYLPHAHKPNQVCYTGTHDNDTLAGYLQTTSPEVREHVGRYFGASDDTIHAAILRAAWRSVCAVSVVPLQDLLGLGSEARMNTPGLVEDNWSWRLPSMALLGGELAPFLAEEAQLSGRIPA